MTNVLLLHHAQGRTLGVVALADRLRDAGHTVSVPDFYDGHVFTDLEDGLAYARARGFGTIQAEGVASAGAFDGPFAVVGLSMGVMAAQELAQTNPHVTAAAFISGCLPAAEFGAWPAGVPVQVHGADGDPLFTDDGDLDSARDLVADAADGALFVYPLDGHLFVDSSLPEYDETATDQVVDRVLALLKKEA